MVIPQPRREMLSISHSHADILAFFFFYDSKKWSSRWTGVSSENQGIVTEDPSYMPVYYGANP